MKRVAAYIRVSTDKQSTDSQLVAIKDAIQRSGDVLVQVYEDHAISGGKSRQDRPALDSMLKDAGAGKLDKVIVWDITRLGRSLSDLIATLNELQKFSVDLQFLQNDLDTSTEAGRMLFSIFGAIGEFERSLTRERVKSGIANARAKGVRLGRPTNCNPQTKATVLELRSKGMSIRKICSLLSIGVAKYYEFTKEQELLAA
jgi:DNA invertase Pin-like site-specific DNA recombinase